MASTSTVHGKLKANRSFMDKDVRVVMPKKPISHQITSGALVRHSSPPRGLWLWFSLPPTHCWSSQSGPGHTSQYNQPYNRTFSFHAPFSDCAEEILWFKVWSQTTFRRSLNLRFSRDVGSNMILSAFSSDNVRHIKTVSGRVSGSSWHLKFLWIQTCFYPT